MGKSATKERASPLAKPYQPTPEERTVALEYLSRMEGTPPLPKIKVRTKQGVVRLEPDHPDREVGFFLLRRALGISEDGLFDGFFKQLVTASSLGQDVDEKNLNFMLSVIAGIRPQDQLETLLAVQMAAVHLATMTMAGRLNSAENLKQQDSAERAFNKLTRTFAQQMEALRKYRTGGEQKVTVQHVTVGEGGQAIVGNVEGGRDGRS